MQTDPPVTAPWETIGWIAVDTAVCAFGDAEELGEDFRLTVADAPPSPRNVEDHTLVGVPLIAYRTRDDVDLPVEVVRGRDGAIVCARLSAVDDLDELDGTWRPAGVLELTTGRCMAADPYSPPTAEYRLTFDVAPGTWNAEVFDEGAVAGEPETLALRITLAG